MALSDDRWRALLSLVTLPYYRDKPWVSGDVLNLPAVVG